MATLFLKITNLILYCILLAHSAKLKDDWFTFPISNQNAPLTQQMISNAIKQLSEKGVFHLKHVLSHDTIHALKYRIKTIMRKNGILESGYRSNKLSSNIFGDKGDDTYKSRHPRNKKLHFGLSGIPRYQLSESSDIFVQFYEHKPLRHFLKTIITSTTHELPLCDPWIHDCKQWKDLYGGTSKESESIYVGVLQDGDSGGYHLDQNGITCAFMISEAEFGGDFIYKWIAPMPLDTQPIIERDFKWDWKSIKKVINDDIGVSSFHPGPGDLHCFKGNISLHKIDMVEGKGYRIALVMNFWEENIALTKPVQEIIHHEL